MQFLPVFIPWNRIKCQTGSGSFCLYHGNLSVNENEKAAIWLMEEVFNKLKIPFVIAGKNPTSHLKKMVHLNNHTCLVENPTEFELDDLIQKAQINILPSFNKTGVKLKLLNALFNGRHCLVNEEGAGGSGTESLCCIAKDSLEFIKNTEVLFELPFTEEDINKRKSILENLYNNKENAKQIITLLY